MGDQPNILFVDDEDSIRLTLPPLLQSYGFEVTSAATVAEALDLITRHKFDVLISDLNIGHPGDGFTVVSAMRSHQPNALRFILTAYPAFESALEAIREEVHDYFVKPTETEVLVGKIRSKLAQRSPDQSRIRQRLTQVIRANRESVVENWLQAVQKDSEISSIPVPDSERKEHVPLLLDVATDVAEGKELTADNRKAYVRHGAIRYRQGYTVPLLIREAREPLSNSSILKETGIPVCTGHRCSQGSLPPCRNPPFTRISQTLRPGHCQSLAVQVQVHQREAGAQPMMVLAESSVSHLLKAKDALQNPKRMFYFRSYSRLHPVLGLL